MSDLAAQNSEMHWALKAVLFQEPVRKRRDLAFMTLQGFADDDNSVKQLEVVVTTEADVGCG